MTRPLWVDPDDRRFPVLDHDIEVDVVIVGGGFSGIGAAWALRDERFSIALLESETIGSGASGRNAGFVLSGPAMPYCESLRLVGTEQTSEIWRLTKQNQRELESLIDEFGLDCGYLRRGSMSLAASDEEWGDLQDDVVAMRAAGIPVCPVDAADLPRGLPDLYRGGIYYGGNGELNPGAFLRGLAPMVASRVDVYEESRVQSMREGTVWRLHTEGGTVSARTVLIATNAYTSAFVPSAPIAPRRGQVLATNPIDRVVVPFPIYADHGWQYWRQTADGRVVVGGWRNLETDTEVGVEEYLSSRIQGVLSGFLRTIAGPGIGARYRWAGIMGFTPDHFPLVGPVPGRPGLHIAAGYSGHGVCMAFLCGALAARAAVGFEAHIPHAFDPVRFHETFA